ncbi:MAG: hypothetical protein U0842_23245 [Candidatus Binatia bacterium]
MDARDGRSARSIGRLRAAAFTLLLMLLVATPLAHAGPAKLVKDIERSSSGCSLSRFVAGPDALYVGTDATCRGGLALWRTDGSAAGTRLVRSFEPGPGDLSHVEPIAMAGGLLYFGLSRDVAGDFDVFELWRTDGTADGTVRVWQASGGQRYPYWRYLVDRTEGAFDGRLIFVVDDGQASTALWASDGTPQGTKELRQLGADHRFVQSFLATADALFVLEQGPAGHSIWRTDGTVDGTWQAVVLTPSFYDIGQPEAGPDGFVYYGVHLAPGTNELWRTRGTPETTARVASLPFATTWVLAEGVHYVLEARRIGVNLYRLDPETGQIALLRNVDPAPRGDNDLTIYARGAGLLYFSQYSFLGGRERLWRSDGTVAGTFQIHQGLVQSGLRPAANGFLFQSFTDDDVDGLWFTDGTVAGTRPIIKPYWQNLGGVAELPSRAATLLAVAEIFGRWELRRTDGTAAGTSLIRRLPSPPANVATGERGVAMVINSALWVSDGTADGTVKVVELGPWTAGSSPGALTPSGDALFFTVAGPLYADDANELWRSDGTRAGTQLVEDFADGEPAVRLLTPSPSGILFAHGASELRAADAGGNGTRLVAKLDGAIREILVDEGAAFVAVDGPAPGTGALLRVDANDGAADVLAPVVARSLVRFADGVFFATPPSQGADAALWRSHRGTGKTKPIATFAARGGFAPDVGPLFPGDGVMFFGVAWAGSTELWRSDGTAAGTTMVAALDATMAPSVKRVITQASFLDGALLFSFPTWPDHDGSKNLWRSDGTKDGTKPVAAVTPFRQLAELTPFDGRIAFRSPFEGGTFGFDETPGVWITDGTEAGTERIFDGGVLGGTLVAAGDTLFFCGVPPEEFPSYPFLFRSDGSAAGTQPLPGRRVYCRGATAAAGDSLFFPSTNRRWGDELWSLPLDTP